MTEQEERSGKRRKKGRNMDTLLSFAQENSTGSSSMSTLVWIATAVGLWKMFDKAGEPGWIGLVPFYNRYKLCEKVMGNPWYWLRQFVVLIPIIGLIGYFYFEYQIGKATAKAYGQDDTWAWGYTFLSRVFYCITGFGDYKYYGVYGSGDSRTGEARQAKTVNFDVVKQNQTSDGVVINDVRPETPKAESAEVEFTLDRSDSE